MIQDQYARLPAGARFDIQHLFSCSPIDRVHMLRPSWCSRQTAPVRCSRQDAGCSTAIASAFETRYLHVPSAHRCLSDIEDGWWATFEIGPPVDENVTGILDSGGLRVDLVNATATQVKFARWMMDRFERAGLGVPEVRAIRFPPSPQCAGRGGLAVESDELHRGLSITLEGETSGR